jgi:hypothetical protein
MIPAEILLPMRGHGVDWVPVHVTVKQGGTGTGHLRRPDFAALPSDDELAAAGLPTAEDYTS